MTDAASQESLPQPLSLLELAVQREETKQRLLEYQAVRDAQTVQLKEAFDSSVGQTVTVGGEAYGWVDESKSGDFETFSEGEFGLLVGDWELVRTIPHQMDDEPPTFWVVVRVPELGEKQQLILEIDKAVFRETQQ